MSDTNRLPCRTTGAAGAESSPIKMHGHLRKLIQPGNDLHSRCTVIPESLNEPPVGFGAIKIKDLAGIMADFLSHRTDRYFGGLSQDVPV